MDESLPRFIGREANTTKCLAEHQMIAEHCAPEYCIIEYLCIRFDNNP